MKIILIIFSLFLIIFIIGCGKGEIVEETKKPIDKITAQVYDIDDLVVADEVVEEEEENIVTVRLCHDTDNGLVRWVNGTIFGFYNNTERFEYNDYCFDHTFLIEFYCENEAPQNRSFLCTNGCEDNHCL